MPDRQDNVASTTQVARAAGVVKRLDEHVLAIRQIAANEGDRPIVGPRDINEAAVGTDRDPCGIGKRLPDRALPVGGHIDDARGDVVGDAGRSTAQLGQRATGRVAPEDANRVRVDRGRVEVSVVR